MSADTLNAVITLGFAGAALVLTTLALAAFVQAHRRQRRQLAYLRAAWPEAKPWHQLLAERYARGNGPGWAMAAGTFWLLTWVAGTW